MNKIKLIFSTIFVIILLSGLVLGTNFFLKTSNTDFKEDPLFYKSLGNELVKNGRINEAIAAYEKSLSIAEDNDIRNNLAIMYYREGKYSDAIGHLRLLVANSPDNPSFHYDLAVNLVDKFRNTEDKDLADLYEALSEYESANKISPGYSNTHNNIAALKQVLNI